MAPRMASGEVATGARNEGVTERPPRLTITLYDLFAVIQDVVDPHDDTLVVATMTHLLRSGRFTWCGTARARSVPVTCRRNVPTLCRKAAQHREVV
jgi:hypothetical protein